MPLNHAALFALGFGLTGHRLERDGTIARWRCSRRDFVGLALMLGAIGASGCSAGPDGPLPNRCTDCGSVVAVGGGSGSGSPHDTRADGGPDARRDGGADGGGPCGGYGSCEGYGVGAGLDVTGGDFGGGGG